jgi:HEAT repeat protein
MIWLMGKTQKRGCMKYIVNMLEDADGDVRAAAVGALSKFKRKQLMGQLQKVLQDPNERVRAAAVNAISSSGDKSAYPLIEEMLSDVDEFVRKRAAIGLAKLDATKAQKTIMKALKRYPELEHVSTGMLYGAGIYYEELPKMHSEAKKVVLELCPEEEMANLALSSREMKKRLHGIRVLALNQGTVFREIIKNALKDPSPEIREEAQKYKSR